MSLQKTKDFFALNTPMYATIALIVFVGMGERMAERFLPLYVLAVGGTTVAVGMLNAFANFLGAVYAMPGGYLSDRIGHKRALTVFTLLAMLGYLIVIIFPYWQSVFVGAAFFISWSSLTLPAVMSLVSKIVRREKRTMGVTVNSFVRRIPMALGPLIGGYLITAYGRVDGVRLAFMLALVLAGVAVFLLEHYLEDEPVPEKSASVSCMFCNIKGPLRDLLISDVLIRFAEQIPYAFIVVWVVENCGQSPSAFGILTAIEMITAMLVYIPVAYFADKGGKKPFVLMTFVFFALFPLVLLHSKSFPLLVVAFIVRGLKEFGEPTRKALIMDLAPENAKAGTFGAYYLIRDILTSVAALASAFLWNISPAVNFLTAFGFGLAGIIVFALYGKDVNMREQS